MKKNKFNIALLLFGLLIVTCSVLELNDENIKNHFLYKRKSFLLDNYFLPATAMYFLYACLVEDLIKRKEILITRVVKIVLGGLFFSVVLFEYGIVKEFLIVLNISIIVLNYKKIRLLIFVIPLMVVLSFISQYAIKNRYQNDFITCQNNNLDNEQAESCIIEFGSYNHRTENRVYLTKGNIELAKNNKKIKQLIEKKVIDKNDDENCKINEKYEVPNIRNKRGIPCMG